MLFSADHNALIYKLADPTPILATCDGARQVNGGHVAVPLTLRNAQILAHLGHPAMSPIEQGYDWPCRFDGPRPNQRVSAAFKTLRRRCFDISDMRTGKTLSTLWAADFLMMNRQVNTALILSPLSTLKRVWEDEIFASFHGRRKAVILHGSREQRMEKLDQDVDFLILNHDGLTIGCKRDGRRFSLGPLAQELIARKDINLIVIDEASAYKHGDTNRWRVLSAIIESKPDAYVWALTGTPAANSPTDCWALGRLIYGRARKPESFMTFRARTMFRVSEFKWKPIPGAENIVREFLQPAIRFTRKELGFPPLSYETREVELSTKQAAAYKEMKKNLALVTERGHQIDAVNEASLRTKLIQISCGMIYDGEHVAHDVDAKPRLQALDDILEEAGSKIIVFAPLTSVIVLIHTRLTKAKVSAERIDGSVSAGARNKIFAEFRDKANPRVLVADPRTMAHGLNLSVANTIVWFGPIDSLEVYSQANARIDSPESAGVVIHLSSTPVEREIFRRLEEKQNLQGAILALLQGN